MKKWLKRHKALLIGLGIIFILMMFIRSWSVWLLSTASPRIFKSVYQQSNERQEDVEPSQITYLRDTLYIDGHKIISHKSLEYQSENKESTSTSNQNWQNDGISPEELGVLGDSAGLWNALFSGLALIGVIITICYQTYKDDKNEKIQQITRFQDEFYRLLDFFTKIVVEIEIKAEDKGGWDQETLSHWNHEAPVGIENKRFKIIRGRECFKYVYDGDPVNSIIYYANRPSQDVNYDDLEVYFDNYFSHYFRLLYRILRYIDTVDDKINCRGLLQIKQECFGVLKANLSTYEFIIIFYNGLLSKNSKAKQLYEKARLFDNLKEQLLIFPKEREYYKRLKQQIDDSVQPDNCPSKFYHYKAFKKSNKKRCKWNVNLKYRSRYFLRNLDSWFRDLRAKQVSGSATHEELLLSVVGDQELSFNDIKKLDLPISKNDLKKTIETCKNTGKIISYKRGNVNYYKRVD